MELSLSLCLTLALTLTQPGAEGVVATFTTIEGRMLKKDEDATVGAL